MGLAAKLNLKPRQAVRVLNKPAGVDLDDVLVSRSAGGDAVLLFVKTLADVDAKSGPVVQAAKADRIAWIAYPKAGQLGTDLKRDVLWTHLWKTKGIQGVRQVSIDQIWSALRFRPAQ
jgi:hypothetical protein